MGKEKNLINLLRPGTFPRSLRAENQIEQTHPLVREFFSTAALAAQFLFVALAEDCLVVRGEGATSSHGRQDGTSLLRIPGLNLPEIQSRERSSNLPEVTQQGEGCSGTDSARLHSTHDPPL